MLLVTLQQACLSLVVSRAIPHGSAIHTPLSPRKNQVSFLLLQTNTLSKFSPDHLAIFCDFSQITVMLVLRSGKSEVEQLMKCLRTKRELNSNPDFCLGQVTILEMFLQLLAKGAISFWVEFGFIFT